MAVCFLIFEIISSASSAIVSLTYYNEAKQECSNLSSDSDDDDGEGDVSVGNYDKTLQSMAYAVAKAMHKAYGYKPELIYAQIGHETGFKPDYTVGTEDLNLSGIKYLPSMSAYATPGQPASDGGSYCKFKSLDAYATVYYKQFLHPDFGNKKPKTVEEWAHLLKLHTYYTDSESNYVNGPSGMKHYVEEYKKYDAAHKNDSKKDNAASKKKTGSSKKKNNSATKKKKASTKAKQSNAPKKKKTAVVISAKKKKPSDFLVDVDKSDGSSNGQSNEKFDDLVMEKDKTAEASLTAAEKADEKKPAKSESKTSQTPAKDSSASSSKKDDKVASKKNSTKKSSSSEKDKAKDSSKKKKDDSDSDSSDDSDSKNSLGMTEDSCKAMGFETEDDESSGEWAYPFKGMTYKSAKAQMDSAQAFGVHAGNGRKNNYHDGVDFGTAQHNGQAIRAIHGGKVIDVGFKGTTQDDIGGYVVTKSSDGWYIVYQEFVFSPAESDVIKVKKGETVEAGETIGILSSSTANVNHVHIGATKQVWSKAISNSFSSAGGWKDPLELIKKGIASGGSLGNLNMTGNDKQRAKAMIKAMKKMDPKATNEGIAAILGNWTFESGHSYLKPDSVNSGSGAKGLGQWLGNRAAGLDAYAKKKGKSWKDPAVQLEFAYKCEGSDSEIFKKILRSKGSAYDLGYSFSQKWERGGYDEGHAKSARAFYNEFFK